VFFPFKFRFSRCIIIITQSEKFGKLKTFKPWKLVIQLYYNYINIYKNEVHGNYGYLISKYLISKYDIIMSFFEVLLL